MTLSKEEKYSFSTSYYQRSSSVDDASSNKCQHLFGAVDGNPRPDREEIMQSHRLAPLYDSSGLNVPPVSLSNVPGTAESIVQGFTSDPFKSLKCNHFGMILQLPVLGRPDTFKTNEVRSV